MKDQIDENMFSSKFNVTDRSTENDRKLFLDKEVK